VSPPRALALIGALALIASAAPAWAGTYKQLYGFHGGNDGATPKAGLIELGGVLYGTTASGGPDGDGTVFAFNPATGVETVVHSFQGSDGATPVANLMEAGGIIYGTTGLGGAKYGTVFSVNPKSGAETVVYSFRGGSDGAAPEAGLIDVKGTLYGTTSLGGNTGCNPTSGCGTVFSLNPRTGAKSVLYEFAGGNDGAIPLCSLMTLGGVAYGTTSDGGKDTFGTVFSLNLQSGAETVLHTFAAHGYDGAHPYAGLTKVGAALYGTTFQGGASGNGIVYSLAPKNDRETVVYAFKGSPDGASPQAGLIDVGGTLYGTTASGGGGSCDADTGCGTIFSVNPKTGVETVLYGFQGGTDGATPQASLVNVNGTLYGTTAGGGDPSCNNGNACGTLFSYTP
jgi:uncharacterized repeat protein (TIGR03803 family)